MLAIEDGYEDIVSFLMKFGADTKNITNSENQTAHDLAVHCGIADLLGI